MNTDTAIQIFKKAIVKALNNGELHKDYPHKRRVRKIRKSLEMIEDTFTGGIEAFSIVPLVMILSGDGMVFASVFYTFLGLLDENEAER